MEKEEEIFSRAMRDYDDYKRTRAIKAVFRKESITEDLHDFNRLIRAFCWLKTLICIWLRRTNGSHLDSGKFCILAYDFTSGMEYQSWDSCWVSPHLFRDWNVCLCSDGG